MAQTSEGDTHSEKTLHNAEGIQPSSKDEQFVDTGPAQTKTETDTHSQVSQGASAEQQAINDNEPIPALPPPNGGFMAWMQVASSFLILFNVLGLLNTYGQFQTIYETEILKNDSSSTISWIGSTQYLVCYLVCIFTGPLWDAGRLYLLLVTGTVVMVFGLMMLSLSHEYYQLFLAQAVVTGVGFGFVFLPATGIAPQWFSTRAPFAVGIATTGSSIGAVIYPIMLQKLTAQIGFPWAVRAIAFMVLGTMGLATSMMRVRIGKNLPKRKVVDLRHLTDIPYLLSCLAFFVGFLGLYVFYFYINIYAVEVTDTPQSLAFYLLAILNAGSFLGRLLPSYAAGHMGAFNVQIIFGVLSSVLAFSLLAVKNTIGIIVFTAFYGFVSGPFVTLPIPVVTSVSPDKSLWGTRLGMSFAFIGFGVLIGEPVAGAILGNGENKNWTGLILWCGLTLMSSSIILSIARVKAKGTRLFIKA